MSKDQLAFPALIQNELAGTQMQAMTEHLSSSTAIMTPKMDGDIDLVANIVIFQVIAAGITPPMLSYKENARRCYLPPGGYGIPGF